MKLYLYAAVAGSLVGLLINLTPFLIDSLESQLRATHERSLYMSEEG